MTPDAFGSTDMPGRPDGAAVAARAAFPGAPSTIGPFPDRFASRLCPQVPVVRGANG